MALFNSTSKIPLSFRGFIIGFSRIRDNIVNPLIVLGKRYIPVILSKEVVLDYVVPTFRRFTTCIFPVDRNELQPDMVIRVESEPDFTMVALNSAKCLPSVSV